VNVEKIIAKSSKITAIRGVGSSLYIDAKDAETARDLHSYLFNHGVIVKLNGERGIAIKPALVLEENHSHSFCSILQRF
jgi:acetylornithine/succinyldiaminopimelate/putrescine aminotransferase